MKKDEDDEEKIDRRSRNPRRSQKALFKSRTVLIFGEVDMKMAERVTAQLLAYAAKARATSASSSIRPAAMWSPATRSTT